MSGSEHCTAAGRRPGPELEEMPGRERALAEAGGTVFLPDPTHAYPAGVCGHAQPECRRALPLDLFVGEPAP